MYRVNAKPTQPKTKPDSKGIDWENVPLLAVFIVAYLLTITMLLWGFVGIVK